MNYLIGIDLGTSSTKTILFNENGEIIKEKSYKYPMYNQKELWAEQKTDDWYNAVIHTLKYVIKNSNVDTKDIKSIGISGQMHGLVIVDDKGKSIRNSIIWCDGRTKKECKQINQLIGENQMIKITGNPALTGFTLSKILWIKENEPHNYHRIRKILLPKDYIRYRLTGEYFTDYSDASGTNLLDISNKVWSQEILSKFNINKELLPTIKDSSEICGYITKDISLITGLEEGTPVVTGAADNAAAAVGIGVINQGESFMTIGTSGVIFSPTNKPKVDKTGRIHTFISADKDKWANLSCTLSAAQSAKWFREKILNNEDEEVNNLKNLENNIKNIPIGSNGIIFLPYLMGERSPILDEKARACFIGLTNAHNYNDMYRSILEGVAYSQKQCLDIVNDMGIDFNNLRVGGGGTSSNVWLNMFSDVLNVKIETVESTEIASLGAALLAGVGAGVYRNIDEAVSKVVKYNNIINPNEINHNKYMKYYKIYNDLYGNLKLSFEQIHKLQD